MTDFDRNFLEGEEYRREFELQAAKARFVSDQIHGRGSGGK